MRRRALRHGDARLAGGVRTHLGHRAPISSGRRRRSACGASIRTSCSWPRSTGTWNGRCSSRASITPTTSGSTIACATVTRGRCASISMPGSITRTSWPASWKTTMNRGRRRRSTPEVHQAAAVITFLSPGLRFFHQGQFEGRKKRISPHLVRGAGRTDRREAQAVLRPAACRAAPAGRARWPVAIARMRSRLGGQLDLGLFRGVCLAGPRASGCWWR